MSKNLAKLDKTLEAIADGYPYSWEYFPQIGTAIVLVENPEYQEDDGSGVYLGFEVVYNE